MPKSKLITSRCCSALKITKHTLTLSSIMKTTKTMKYECGFIVIHGNVRACEVCSTPIQKHPPESLCAYFEGMYQ